MVGQVSSLKTEIKYKDTPIGKIPVDWELMRLSKIGKLRGGSGFPVKYQGHSNLQYLFVKVSDMNLPGNEIYITNSVNTIDEKLRETIKCDIFPKDTIVFAKVGAALLLNRRRILKRESAIDNNMMGFNVGRDYHPKFYYYILQSIDFAKYVFSGALPSVNQKIIGDINVVSPTFNEQKKIAEILTTVDDAIEKTTQVIENANELKKGLMQRLLTRGIGHKKFKKTEIGEIPVEWKVVKLGQVANLKNGINFKKEQKGERGILTIDVLNMYSTGIYIDSTTLYRIDLDLMNKEDYILKEGDILFVRSSVKREGVGWACLFKSFGEQATFCGFIIRARLISTKIFPEFLIYFLRSDRVRSRLISGSGHVAITNISQNTLQDLYIVIPSYTEQKEIAEMLFSIDEQIEKESNHKEQLQYLKNGLMKVLLTGKLRVAV